ncbi:MAG TPA: RagB/SusD family nutrient uptake outer membrane protein [Sphingobacterium sp.]|nr:RagB/SusD family nutrient uptake outer membrane protein [Sphingobacterium sp.]
MKHNCLKYIFPVLLALTAQSCSLDETLMDRPTPATISTEGDVTALITGLYSRFNDPGMFKFQGHIMLTVCADDFHSFSGSEYGPYAQRVMTSANTGAMWNGLYLTIANANGLIAMLDKLELSEEFEQRAYGEAYFIRAFCFYYLVRLYGGVPIRLTPTTVDADHYLPRTSVAYTYAQIFEDFKQASELLPLKNDIPISELGRASKGAAQAMLAQAYLTYGDQLLQKGEDATAYFNEAVVYADSVINSGQYALVSNYADLFDIGKETLAYNEVIFGIRFQTDPTNRAQPAAGSEYALRFNAANTWYVSASGNNQNGDGVYRVNHWFADHYRMGDYVDVDSTEFDYRNEAAFWQRSTGNNHNIYFSYPHVVPAGIPNNVLRQPLCRKYIDPTGKDNRNHGNDFFIIRLAEVYLIKAEALNELHGGPTPEALTAFNTVRERARKADGLAIRSVPADLTAATAGSQIEFRMKIFDDRGLELVGEGQRWFDLVRMPSPLGNNVSMYEYQFLYRLNNKLDGYPTYRAFISNNSDYPTYNNTTKLWSYHHGIHASQLNVIVPKFLLFPIPLGELVQNKNFGDQNPGW